MSGGDDMKDLVADFVTESREHLSNVEADLLRLEAGGETDKETVNKVFRCVHSVKGVAGFLGFERINELAHNLESTLDLVRKEKLLPSRELVEVLLKAIDQLREMVENASESNTVDTRDNLTRLRRFLEVPSQAEAVAQAAVAGPQVQLVAAAGAPTETLTIAADELSRHKAAGQRLYSLHLSLGEIAMASAGRLEEVPGIVAGVGEVVRGGTQLVTLCNDGEQPPREPLTVIVASMLSPEQVAMRLHVDCSCISEVHGNGKTIAAAPPPPAAPVEEKAPVSVTPGATVTSGTVIAIDPKAAAQKREAHHEQSPDSIRVSVALLDKLMNLSGELVLGRNQLLQAMSSGSEKGRELATSRLNQVVSEMQEAIMQTRMQPIGNVFQKFPRVVRDLAGKLGKKCRLMVEGKDVELDRSILEALGDPLTHLVRNSIDHGIEMPEARQKQGKPVEGTIELQAYHQGGNVKILIVDDGGGIDPERLRKKAVEKGVITQEQARTMADREAIMLIFAAGFSTAEKVTDVSGRGVGMDVVRSNIEKLGGNVDVQSSVGKGTTITITIPLTLAILPSLVVSCGEGRYVLPQTNVNELVRIPVDDSERRIVQVKGRDVLRLRGKLLPVVRLRDVFAEGTATAPAEPAATAVVAPVAAPVARRAENIMVVESGSLQYGLVVDSPPDAEEIVVKPLGRHVKGRPEYAGCTILGDGRVAMILDVAGVAATVNLRAGEVQDAHAKAAAAVEQKGTETADLVLFRNHQDELFAVPLGLVGRIQRLQPNEITEIAGNLVHGTAERAMPLLRLESLITAKAPEGESKSISVLVLRLEQQEFGLIAPQVEDIKAVAMNLDGRTLAQDGVLGSFQIKDKTVRLLDVASLARRGLPQLFAAEPVRPGASEAGAAASNKGPGRVLFAEDSNFFRTHVRKILETAGFAVTAAEDGDLAWQTLLATEQPFDIIVTDIQMPNCDGLELSRRVRKDGRYAALPILALTSLSSQEDIERGKLAGITDYRIKLDDAALVAAVRELSGVEA